MFYKLKNHKPHCNKSEKRMHTSRAALNWLLDENDSSLTLTTLAIAASTLGKKVNLQLAAAWPKISIQPVYFLLCCSNTSAEVEQLEYQISESTQGVELLGNLVRAPRLASNFHVKNDGNKRKFDYFGWKFTLCNFWGYYTKYYTFIKNTYKSLIYMGFSWAWLSVNQRFSGQNLDHYLGQFFSVTIRFINRSMQKSS